MNGGGIKPFDSPRQRRILVVDDSTGQRLLLSTALRPTRHEVVMAASAEEALELHRTRPFDFVLSDWMMPGMSGLDLCRAFRELPTPGYCYFILLTSKSGSHEVTLGLQAGADDFLSKPLNMDELHARMAAGERILSMAEELSTKNRLIGSTLSELQKLYDAFERDLVEARKLQQSLVPEREREFEGGRLSLLLRPSGQIGGDLVGFFPISRRRLGLYAIDVSGHGVTSAIMTARLAAVLSGAAPERNIALLPDGR
ncbi:response regulator, partial [Thioclava sp. BHET1]